MSTERMRELAPERRNARFVIGRVGKVMLGSTPETPPRIPGDIERIVRPVAPIDPDPYEHMALSMFVRFAQARDKAPLHSSRAVTPIDAHDREVIVRHMHKSSAILNGFTVMGRIFGLVPQAYRQYYEETGATPSMADIRTILKHDESFKRTAGFLSNMPNPLNRIWEEHIGLTGSLYVGARGDLVNYPSLVIAGREALPYLDIAQMPRQGAVIEAYQAGITREGGTCAAKDVYLPKLWEAMSDECCTNPEMFAAELQVDPLSLSGVQ